jgi:hypothetical protein
LEPVKLGFLVFWDFEIFYCERIFSGSDGFLEAGSLGDAVRLDRSWTVVFDEYLWPS